MNVEQFKSGWSGELKASSQTKASFVTKADESILTFYQGTSMTSLLTHTVAHSTRLSFRPKTNNQSNKRFFKSCGQFGTVAIR